MPGSGRDFRDVMQEHPVLKPGKLRLVIKEYWFDQ